jgi:phosphoserine phosphatase RsbU/P
MTEISKTIGTRSNLFSFDGTKAVLANRRRRFQTTVVATLLGCMLIAIAAIFFWHERTSIKDKSSRNSTLHAKVLEDQTTRLIGDIELITFSVANSIIRVQGLSESQTSYEKILSGSLAGQQYLRSISLVDDDGHVLASSMDIGKNKTINWADFDNISSENSAFRLSSLLAGHHLGNLKLVTEAESAPLSIAAIRRVALSETKSLHVVALLNIDYLARNFGRLIGDSHVRATLLSYDGQLILATENLKQRSGGIFSSNDVFSKFVLKNSHGVFVGLSLDKQEVIGAYQVSNRWPLVIIVDEPMQQLAVQLQHNLFWFYIGFFSLLALLFLGVVVIRNTAKRDESLTEQLQVAYNQSIELKARTESILEASLDAVITLDDKGLVNDCNFAARQMFGDKLLQARVTPAHKILLAPEFADKLRHDLPSYLSGGNKKLLNRRMEVEVITADNTPLPVEITLVPITTPSEAFYTLTIRDISDRLRAELELRESEERWNLALEAAGDGVWDWHIQADYKIYSMHWLTMLGYSAEDLKHNHVQWISLLHSDDEAEVQSKLQAHLDRKSPTFAAECRMLCKNGQWKWVHVRGLVVTRDRESGAALRLVGTQTDISDRKQTEVERAALLVKSRELAYELQLARATELNVGSRIQRSLLLTAQIKNQPSFWVSTFNQASQGVDGDFVEIICPRPDVIDLIVGDVMGKGVNAALMGAAVKMQLSRSMIELLNDAHDSRELPRPADLVLSVSQAVSEHLQALDAFVTLCYVRIDHARSTVTWVGCGHEEPMLLRSNGTCELLPNQHPPLGVLEESQYNESTIAIHPEDSIFLHSDGATDAMLPSGERIGHEMLREVLALHLKRYNFPSSALHMTRRRLFGEDVRFTDDLTMVLATCANRRLNRARVEVEIALDSIKPIREFLLQESEEIGFEESEISLFTVACVEAFTNIVRHAKGLLPDAPLEIIVTKSKTSLTVQMYYLAEAYLPDELPYRPDLDLLPEGGFGMSIIRDVCDIVKFDHVDGVNSVSLTKEISAKERFEAELDSERLTHDPNLPRYKLVVA